MWSHVSIGGLDTDDGQPIEPDFKILEPGLRSGALSFLGVMVIGVPGPCAKVQGRRTKRAGRTRRDAGSVGADGESVSILK